MMLALQAIDNSAIPTQGGARHAALALG